MIEKLTPAQEAAMPHYREEGIRLGLATEDNSLSQAELEALVHEAYRNGGLNPPGEVVYLDSPSAALDYLAHVSGKSRKEVWSQSQIFYGQHEAHWFQFYSFFKNEVGVAGMEKLDPIMNLGYKVGWCWFFKQVAVVTRRPTELHMEHGRLHNRNGMAIKYKDGTGYYFMNGVRFTGKEKVFVTTPADSSRTEDVLAIQNVEQRSEVMKKIGIEKFFSQLPKKELDSISAKSALDKGLIAFGETPAELSYSLFEVTIGNYRPRKYLKMNNPSTDEILLEAVHPDCTTVAQALKYRNFGEFSGKFIPPRILT